MRTLIISDTHGRHEGVDEILEREGEFDMLIHLGDVEGGEIYLDVMFECPKYIVRGNNDFFSDLPREEEIEIAGKKFLVTHGHHYGVSIDETGVAEEAHSRNCDGVMFGHTHRPVLEVIDGILAINPGSLSYPRQMGRRPSYVVLETDEDGNITGEIKYL